MAPSRVFDANICAYLFTKLIFKNLNIFQVFKTYFKNLNIFYFILFFQSVSYHKHFHCIYDCQYVHNVPPYRYTDEPLKKKTISLFWNSWAVFHSIAIVNTATVNVLGSIPHFTYEKIQTNSHLTVLVKGSEERNERTG